MQREVYEFNFGAEQTVLSNVGNTDTYHFFHLAGRIGNFTEGCVVQQVLVAFDEQVRF